MCSTPARERSPSGGPAPPPSPPPGVPVCWTDHLGGDGAAEPGFAAHVDAVIDELLGGGLEVVVNVHHFDAVQADPAGQAHELTELWRQLAARHAARSPSSSSTSHVRR
jgi:hypothetical protein